MVVVLLLLLCGASFGHDYISGEKFAALADHRYPDVHPENVRRGDIVYLPGDYLKDFLQTTDQHIEEPYILLTHNSDENIDDTYREHIEKAHAACLFCQNVCLVHPKVHPLPIGLANTKYPHGNTKHFDEVIPRTPALQDKPYLLYLNFTVGTNPRLRAPVHEFFSKSGMCTPERMHSHKKYLVVMGEYKFVISPPGNGLDCHRTWEALYLGCIPIVKKNTMNLLLYDLPCLQVDSWNGITKELLLSVHAKYLVQGWNTAKLSFRYWKDRILKEQVGLR